MKEKKDEEVGMEEAVDLHLGYIHVQRWQNENKINTKQNWYKIYTWKVNEEQ